MFWKKIKISFITNSALADSPVKSKPTLQTFIVNITGMVRDEILEGRDYKVVPMVMLNEGVHKGSGGRLYYPKEELAKIPQIWNSKPIVVYHPGEGESVSDVAVLNKTKVGLILNTKFEDGKLKAEAWLEPHRCDIVDKRIMPCVNAGNGMQISTGLFTENEEVSGTFNGEDYDFIARNYMPDHVALLPDKEGADKASGLMLNEKVEGKGSIFHMIIQNVKNLFGFETNVLSHSKTHMDLSTLLDDTLNTGDDINTFIEDVFPDFFIYHTDGKLWKQSYNIDENDKVSFVGERKEVFRITEFRTLEGVLVANKHSGKENEMLKKDIVENLIKNEKVQFNEEDREFLMGLDEKQLNKIAPVENEDEKKEDEKEKDEKKEEETKVIPPESKETIEENAAKFLENAPADVKALISNGLETYNTDKAKSIASIIANESNGYTDKDLQAKDLKELKIIQNLCAKSEEVAPVYNFSAQAPVFQNNNHVEEALDLPSMNYNESK